MRRLVLMLLVCGIALAARGMAPRAACWRLPGETLVAVLAEGQVRLGRVTEAGITDLGAVPADGVTTLVAGAWHGTAALLGARGKALVRLDLPRRQWVALGDAPAPMRELLPAPGGAVLLTGTPGTPVPADGAVWWATWTKKFSCTRVMAVKADYRPWALAWTGVPGETRLAVATYKATQFAPFEHNCLFLFTWKNGTAEACWLGSRLSRPYREAAHADLRGDGMPRLVAVEETRDGGKALSVYTPIQFGYAREWHTEAIAGLERVAAYGNLLLCWGRDPDDHPCAWRLEIDGQAYRLRPLPTAPPAPEDLTTLDPTRLAGWWEGAWRVLQIADIQTEHH